jgi:rRNA maturation RNase YbeY
MIELRNSQKSLSVDESSVCSLSCYVLEELNLPACDVSVSLVGDQEMTELNSRYFGKSGTTDVISFPMEGGAESIRDGILLGDVVLCVPQAVRAAGDMGVSPCEELSLYLIHGMLHLTGEKDGTAEERARMDVRQEGILAQAREAGSLIRLSD